MAMPAISIAKPVSRRSGRTTGRRAMAAAAMMEGARRVGRVQGIAKGSRRSVRRAAMAARSPRHGRMATFVVGSGAGAAAEYLLDPTDGKRRRHMLRDRTTSILRRGSRGAVRKTRYMAGKAQGVVAEATPPGRDASELNDPSLKAKVESELFRPADAPKDSVDVNVESGVVFLRGEVKGSQQRDELLAGARAIDGVSRVENLLHLPGELPPTTPPGEARTS